MKALFALCKDSIKALLRVVAAARLDDGDVVEHHCCLHMSPYVSIPSAYVTIRQHTSAHVRIEGSTKLSRVHHLVHGIVVQKSKEIVMSQMISIRQHTSAYVSRSAYVSIRQHTLVPNSKKKVMSNKKVIPARTQINGKTKKNQHFF